jgi:hypothetical protein
LIHPKNAREGLFGVLERAIAIVENADAVPKLCILLWTMEMEEGVLISIICTLKLILHEKAMSEGAPYVAVLVVDLNSTIEIFNSLQLKNNGVRFNRAERSSRRGGGKGPRDGHGLNADGKGGAIIELMTLMTLTRG